MINLRLDNNSLSDLCNLSKSKDFPYEITKETAKLYCKGTKIVDGTTQTYGAYDEGTKLVSIMTASFCRIFPHEDGPNGKIVHISGAYTHPDYRRQGHASTILNAIERDAEEYGADYICLDSTMDEFYRKKGFIHAPSNESRLWKPLIKKERM